MSTSRSSSPGLEGPSQLEPAAAEVGAHGPTSTSQGRGNFADIEALQIPENDRGPLLLRERVEHGCQHPAGVGRVTASFLLRAVHGHLGGGRFSAELGFRFSFSSPEGRQPEIDGDAIEPGCQIPVGLDILEMTVETEKGLLSDIPCILSVANQAPCRFQNESFVLGDQKAESRFITGPGSADRVRLFRTFHVGCQHIEEKCLCSSHRWGPSSSLHNSFTPLHVETLRHRTHQHRELQARGGVAPDMRRLIRIAFWAALVLVTVLVVVVRLRHGGGDSYHDVTGTPILDERSLEVAMTYPEPIGNVAVSGTGRLFFTVHPESRPEGAKLLEWRNGSAVPWPDETTQKELFQTPLGVVIDRLDRLWVIDHGRHGFGAPRLVGFDLATGGVVHDHRFDVRTAPKGSFLQDLQVSPDGRTVYIADLSFWRKQPAIVVHDVTTAVDRRVLEGHPSVAAQDWLIHTPAKTMTFFGGLAAMKPGIDGIAVSTDGAWLAYGAMSHDTLFRVPTASLLDPSLDDTRAAALIEPLGSKPLSDGLSADLDGGVWITDVEHGAILRRTPGGALETWIKTPRIRWADALSFGPGGWLYIADSAIPEQVMRSRDHILSQAPYHVFRFRPGIDGVPGQ